MQAVGKGSGRHKGVDRDVQLVFKPLSRAGSHRLKAGST